MTERKLGFVGEPGSNPDAKPFWDAAAAGRVVVKRCADCGKAHWYPRALCPFCFSTRTEFVPASGGGTIYSFSVMRRAEAPYAIAYVTLDEGVTMMTNIVDCDFDGLNIGQKVRVVLKPTEAGPPVPCFTPA
jgi:uncharacterized OB-fold protein